MTIKNYSYAGVNTTNYFTADNFEYFIAVCRYKTHSYFVAGIQDKASKEQKVLLTIGKGIDKSDLRKGNLSKAYLRTEKMPTSNAKTIEMQAFKMDETQYLDLLILLKQYQNADDPVVAVPIKKERQQQQFTWASMSTVRPGTLNTLNSSNPNSTKTSSEFVKNNPAHTLNFANTCRTTAKAITRYTLNNTSELPNVKNHWLASLPFEAKLTNGNIIGTLFLYPLPPKNKQEALKNGKAREWNVLRKIYQRMDDIAKTAKKKGDKGLANSHEKFEALSKLYEDEYKKLISDEPPNIHILLKNITDWHQVEANKAMIKCRRHAKHENYSNIRWFKPQTSTQKLFNEFEKEYVAFQAKQ